jgi:hypothetical protein
MSLPSSQYLQDRGSDASTYNSKYSKYPIHDDVKCVCFGVAERNATRSMGMITHRQAFLLSLFSLLALTGPENPRRMALAAPATATGLSLPVTLDPVRPRGCGKRLTRRFVASELAGRVGFDTGLLNEFGLLDCGCIDARRLMEFVRADIDDWVWRPLGRGGSEFLDSVICEYGPGLLTRFRKARREFEGRDGVRSGAGDAVLPRASGERSGIFESFEIEERLA